MRAVEIRSNVFYLFSQPDLRVRPLFGDRNTPPILFEVARSGPRRKVEGLQNRREADSSLPIEVPISGYGVSWSSPFRGREPKLIGTFTALGMTTSTHEVFPYPPQVPPLVRDIPQQTPASFRGPWGRSFGRQSLGTAQPERADTVRPA